MFSRLGRFVSRHWLTVIVGWVLVVALLRWTAPKWDDITRDGNLAYLPEVMPSVVGDQLLSEAFPHTRAKSHIAFFVARDDRNLDNDDLSVAYGLARRLKNLHGARALAQGERLAAEASALRTEGKADEAELASQRSEAAFATSQEALDEAVRLDEMLAKFWDKKAEQAEADQQQLDRPARLASVFHNRALLHERCGNAEEAATDREIAAELDASLAGFGATCVPEAAADLPILDVWTWRDEVFGKRLSKKRARLIILQLSSEFMDTGNIRLLEFLETELEKVHRVLPDSGEGQLQVGFSGSAAIGGDMLRAAKESIKNTELFTVVLVILILGIVYRSPILVAMPLITITVSLLVATSIIALLTQVGALPGFEWWNFKVFTTTRIFIVVILFGAGTDYFLFLVARYKEELEHGHAHPDAIARALTAVGDALAASALTTILGLATMFFADFGKFKNSGPAIGLCLAVTLMACITLAPALLRAFGSAVFWPFGTPRAKDADDEEADRDSTAATGRFNWLWERVARLIVAHPGLILVTSVVVLAWPAYHGIQSGDHVTYDFLRQLPRDRPSRQGADVMTRHFRLGETSPLTVVAHKAGGEFDTKAGRTRIQELTHALYIDGVESVRSITDPLGDFPPGKRMGLFDRNSWTKRVASPHPRTQEVFVAGTGDFAGDVTRLDLVLKYDPFSIEAEGVLKGVEKKLRCITEIDRFREALGRYASDINDFPTTEQGLQSLLAPPAGAVESMAARWNGPYLSTDDALKDPWDSNYQYEYPPKQGGDELPDIWSWGADRKPDIVDAAEDGTEDDAEDEPKDDVCSWSLSPDSGWQEAQFAFSGTTAGIRDLKLVTQSDNTRIQILVVLAVLGVLLAILRRPLICLYMIVTVLFSYYVTIGATEWFFGVAYGAEFQGLDWKVPLFLFVILVAIGEDYNVYLATRVLEEQRRRGPLDGLRHAVIRTGGIITSCGVIMAGTFSSMTSGTWGQVIPSWVPLADRIFATQGGPLPAIVQLGFALSLGVILDTFIVRPVLVPAFFAILCRWQRNGTETQATSDAMPRQQRPPRPTANVPS